MVMVAETEYPKKTTDLTITYPISHVSLPINAHSGPKEPDNYGKVSQPKECLGKYLREKFSSDHYLQLSFNYFVKLFFISNLPSKVRGIQTIISGVTIKYYSV